MPRPVEYFNPVSREFPKLREQFNHLGFWSKIAVIGFTALASVATLFALGIGGLAAFRYSVSVFSDDELPASAKNVDQIREAHLFTKDDSETQTDPESEGQSGPIEVDTSRGNTIDVEVRQIEGSKTQYDPEFNGQGTSACTGISLSAAASLLPITAFNDIQSLTIDEALGEGVKMYQAQASGAAVAHSSFESYDLSAIGLTRLKFHDDFSTEDDPYSGTVDQFGEMIDRAVGSLQMPFALVITKSPISILVVIRSPDEFWLFDSHGKDGGKAYVDRFTSADQLVGGLVQLFPYFDCGNLGQNLLYNSFNAYTVRLSE